MHVIGWLLLAAIATPAHAPVGRTPAALRTYMAAYSARNLEEAHAMIPAWARRYSKNCDACHYPVPPRLNAEGQRFKWAGYRYPDAIGEKVEVEKIQNYVAAGTSVAYEYNKEEGLPATNSFSAPAITLFYAGPLGRTFSGFLELEHGPENEIERVVHVSTLWGKENSYGGFRFGQMHNLFEWGVAGFDRPAGITAPTPIDEPLTAAIPFMLGEHALGLEGYYVAGRNRFSAQVLNGITTEGEIGAADADTKKDFLVTDQVLIDEAGSGVQAMGYYGTVVGLDTLSPGLTSHFWRVGLTANKIYRDFELLGGVVYGKDIDLPAGLAFSGNQNRAVGYWVSGQYFVAKAPVALFGRYEFRDPDTDVPDDANRRFVVGAVVPLNLPQYLRWAVEYRLDSPQGGAPKTNNVATEFRLNF